MKGLQVTLGLSRAEAQAVLRAELSAGHGIRRSKVLEAAEAKIRRALTTALGPTP